MIWAKTIIINAGNRLHSNEFEKKSPGFHPVQYSRSTPKHIAIYSIGKITKEKITRLTLLRVWNLRAIFLDEAHQPALAIRAEEFEVVQKTLGHYRVPRQSGLVPPAQHVVEGPQETWLKIYSLECVTVLWKSLKFFSEYSIQAIGIVRCGIFSV